MNLMLRNLRIVHVFMLISLGIFIFLPEWLQPHPSKPASRVVFYAITLNCSLFVIITFGIRRFMVKRAASLLLANPDDKAGLARWYTGYIISFALCESLGLYGMMLRFLGFTLGQVVSFYAAGVGLMLYFRPRPPLDKV